MIKVLRKTAVVVVASFALAGGQAPDSNETPPVAEPASKTGTPTVALDKDIVPISYGFRESAKSPKSPEQPQQVVIQNWFSKMLGANPLTANPQLLGVMSLPGAPTVLSSANNKLTAAEASAAGTCDTICSIAGTLACAPFGAWTSIACGLGSLAACANACGGENRVCINHGGGGKACFNNTRFWWCDTQVDGHKVRAWYDTHSRPNDPVPTAWAPSQGCLRVGFPTRGDVRKFRVCVGGEGCTSWRDPDTGAAARASVMDTRPPAPVAEHLSEPLWRYWKPTNLDHYYRINRDDFGAAVFGYSLEGTEGRIFRQQYAGTVPIYRYWNHGAGDHFYTTNWNELGGGAWGYVYEGIEGYIFPVRYADTVPLYRYWSASAGDHYYTLEHHPQGFCYGHCWSFEGAIGYVFP